MDKVWSALFVTLEKFIVTVSAMGDREHRFLNPTIGKNTYIYLPGLALASVAAWPQTKPL